MATTRIRALMTTVLAFAVATILGACGATTTSGTGADGTAEQVAASSVDIDTCRELFGSTPATTEGPSVVVVWDATRSAAAQSLSSDAAAIIQQTAKARGTATILGVNGEGAAPVIVAKDATLYPAGLAEDTPREDRIVAIAPACVAAIGATAVPTKPGSDILAAYGDAASFANGHKDATILLNTDGLANAGAFSLNEIAPDAEAGTVVTAIKKAGALPSTKATTLISGLGSTAGQRVDAKQRERLDSLYGAICEATGAAKCTIGAYAGAADGVANAQSPDDPTVQLGQTPTIVVDQTANTCDLDLPESLSFDRDSYALRPGAADAIAPVVSALKSDAAARVTVIGHTATASDNKEGLRRFSLKRANAVAGLLQSEGVAASRITAKGVGDADQKVIDVVDGHLVESLAAINRRVELKVDGAVC